MWEEQLKVKTSTTHRFIRQYILQEEKAMEKGTITDLFFSNMPEDRSHVFLLLSDFNSKTSFSSSDIHALNCHITHKYTVSARKVTAPDV